MTDPDPAAQAQPAPIILHMTESEAQHVYSALTQHATTLGNYAETRGTGCADGYEASMKSSILFIVADVLGGKITKLMEGD